MCLCEFSQRRNIFCTKSCVMRNHKSIRHFESFKWFFAIVFLKFGKTSHMQQQLFSMKIRHILQLKSTSANMYIPNIPTINIVYDVMSICQYKPLQAIDTYFNENHHLTKSIKVLFDFSELIPFNGKSYTMILNILNKNKNKTQIIIIKKLIIAALVLICQFLIF